MGKWIVHSEMLSPEQESIINSGISKNIILTGSPGSGKTLVLAYRARRFLYELNIPKEKLKFFVFTNSLKNYIKDGIKLLHIPDECVETFDGWCRKFYSQNLNRKLPFTKGIGPDFQKIRSEILEYLSGKRANPVYDCVLVDEGQDMDDTVFKILMLIAKHITVCMDDKQQIYDLETNKSKVESILKIKSRDSRMIIEAWRCSPYIVELAAAFIENPDERNYFLSQNRKPLVDRQVPYVAISNELDVLNEKMAELIKERMSLNDTIAILAAKNDVVYAIGHRLKEFGIDAEFEKDDLDFSTDKPKVMTYHKAKGLTFDSVFLPSLVSRNFRRFSNPVSKRLLFVGITRAVKWVYMDFLPDSRLDVLEILNELQDKNKIMMEKLDGKAKTNKPQVLPVTENEIEDIL